MAPPINRPPSSVLLCSLGASWAVIPEVLGWLAPGVVDLYAHHPDKAQLDALREKQGLIAPEELWICTTGGDTANRSLTRLQTWWQALAMPLPLRIWVAEGTDQLASQAECLHLRELILRTALLASDTLAPGGQLVVSLAGGRKTMSADMQEAGALFGARAWLHVVGPEPMPEALRKAEIGLFAEPLPPDLALAVMPLIAGTGTRSELLDVLLDGKRVTSARFLLPLPPSGQTCSWALPDDGASLHLELADRQREGSQLLGNYIAEVSRQDHYENWRSLYRLAPARIEQLRQTQLDNRHAAWLAHLPKADLHRHLGGCLHIAAQRTVAQAIWDSTDPQDQHAAAEKIAELLRRPEPWQWNWPLGLQGPQRAVLCAGLLLTASPELIERQLRGVTEPRIALKSQPHGFSAYERPGELTGSAQLSHPTAIKPYAQALMTQAREEGLSYLELRGSPHKYRPDAPGDFVAELEQALAAAGAQTRGYDPANDNPRVGLIWILDRRQRELMESVIAQAVDARASHEGFLLGLDLAGDEGTDKPEALAPAFAPAFAACMPITIHAGEGELAENIWQAAYHLHADRIGHGLTLTDHPQLAQRFRDRSIALELCPTSNREVVGFRDPSIAESDALATYPLRALMNAGLPLCLCTDNPGISRTTLANEYLVAARMMGGMSLWEVLALVRQSFLHTMTSAVERDTLLKACEARVLNAVIGLEA